MVEGRKTERRYFEAFRQHHRLSTTEIRVESGGTPSALVRTAIDLRDAARREARAAKDPLIAYEGVWCVCDVDEHNDLPRARDQAQANAIEMAVSNPCFELWVILHFRPQNAALSRANARRTCQELIPGYDKLVPFHDIWPSLPEACARATELNVRHGRNGTEGGNPSTRVHELVANLTDLAAQA